MSSGDPFRLITSRDVLEVSSAIRLPFEPKGDALRLREAIRAGLAQLDARGALHATYASSVRSPCDTENVLLYNVGMSHFRRLATRGVVFERRFDVAGDVPAGHAHRYRYEVVHEPVVWHWSLGPSVVSWQATLPPHGMDEPAAWWWAVVHALHADGVSLDDLGCFALDVRVGPTSRSLGGLLKPMFDGAIAACHSDATPDLLAVERVSKFVGASAAAVLEALQSAQAPLGDRRVVRAYRDNVQWNPADDGCVVGRLVFDDRLAPGVFAGALRCVGKSQAPAGGRHSGQGAPPHKSRGPSRT